MKRAAIKMKTLCLIIIIFNALAVVNIGLASPVLAAQRGAGAIAKSARLGGDHRRTRFVTDLSEPVDFHVFTLDNPYRVIVDLPAVKFHMPDGLGRRGKGLVTAFRYGLFSADKSRIVIDVKAPIIVEKAYIMPKTADHPPRLVLDIVAATRAEFIKNRRRQKTHVAKKTDREFIPSIAPSLLSTGRPKGTKPVIIIDPGHGGIDSGAIGITKSKEKNIILSVGMMLRDRLRRTGRYKVVMTRETDVFVTLRDRVRIARRHRGELFISVHADSAPGRSGRKVTGGTVYTLSDRGSDREARLLAKKENRSDIIAGIDMSLQKDIVTNILIDLAQRETNNLSVAFARTLIKDMRPATEMRSNAHKSAAFAVLKAPDIPSVLVELGYLTNRTDEARLKSLASHARIADAMLKAVDRYFRKRIAQAPY